MRLAVTENIIFRKMISGWPQISPLTRKWISPLIFTSIHFRKKRERERARARERRRSSPRSRAPATVRRRDWRRDRDRAVDRDLAPSRSRIAIAPWSRSRAVDRDLAPSRSLRERDHAPSIAISDRDRAVIAILCCDRWWFFFLGCGFVFSDLCFPSSFPNTRKYFPENFLKCNQTHGNIFLFRKLAFPENMYFPENVLQQPNTALCSKNISRSCTHSWILSPKIPSYNDSKNKNKKTPGYNKLH